MAGETNQLVDWARRDRRRCTTRANTTSVVASGEQVTAGLLASRCRSSASTRAPGSAGRSRSSTDDVARQGAHRRRSTPTSSSSASRRARSRSSPASRASARDNRITTLGRGGSDTSAVALAAALKADRCDIYTDVDGVYTTDPRIVAKARKLDKITYEEMLEMASLGAKVLQTRSVEMAMKHRVRVQVLSSFDGQARHARGATRTRSWNRNWSAASPTAATRRRSPCCGSPTSRASPPAIFGPLADASINVDMIVQNVSEDGDTTDLTFTVGEGRPRARRAGARRPARAAIGFAELDARHQRRQGVGHRRRHAQPRRRRPEHVPDAGREGHQHPGDLDLGDQDQRADRRGIHRAGRARLHTAYGLDAA